MATRFLLIILCLAFVSYSMDIVSLNGFSLRQQKGSVKNTLGKPIQTLESNQTHIEAYQISDSSYMVFEFLKSDSLSIYSIQITGSNLDMLPFNGLKLGDSKDKVISILGQPSSISKTDVDHVLSFKYANNNYPPVILLKLLMIKRCIVLKLFGI